MDPKRTALVLIEYQNDFTSKGGTLHDAVKGVMEQNNMLQNTVETVKKARAAGCTIVLCADYVRSKATASSAASLTAF
jgi:nicotinamidase-related amidase